MVIIRRDPFRNALALQHRLNSFFGDITGSQNEQEAFTPAAFVPPVDIYEDGQKVALKLEIPGLKQDDLDVRIENNVLTVRGERKFENEEKKENFRRVERSYGSFYRAFTVPTSVDTDTVRASYDAGVLEIELQKKAEAKPKQVKIAIGPTKSIDADKTEATAA